MNTVTKINLSNLKKCNQVWTDMPENDRGRLCLKCNNTIIDFRSLTDSEIAETHVFSEQKVCGLYKKEQLQKPTKETKTLKLNNWNSFYFGLFSFLSFNSFGQEKSEPPKTEQTEKKYVSIINKIKTAEEKVIIKDSTYISGIITDESNSPLPGANIIVKGTRIGVSTNFDGFYRINITDILEKNDNIILTVSYIGYETVERLIEKKQVINLDNRSVNIQLEESAEIIEFYIKRAPIHKRIWYKVKNIFRKK